MKALALIFSLLVTSAGLGQSTWMDDFEDGDLTNSPSWQGDVQDFIVNSSGRMQLMAASEGVSRIYGYFDANDSLEFNLFFQLGFEPSASNRLRIFPGIDNPDPDRAKGTAFSIGESGSNDAIHWYGWDHGSAELLASGTPSAVAGAGIPVNLHMKYKASLWTITATYLGPTPIIDEWRGEWPIPRVNIDTLYLVLECTYTSTRRDLFELDDIYAGPPLQDFLPPMVTGKEITSTTSCELVFNEEVNPATLEASNFLLRPDNVHPLEVIEVPDQPNRVRLNWANPFISGKPYTLQITRLEDLHGNASDQVSVPLIYVEYGIPAYGDIVFNELMVDPSPSQGLPDAEYIELFNGSDRAFALDQLHIRRGNADYPLPPQAFLPGNYLVLTAAAAASVFEPISEVTPLTSFPRLTNTGDRLELFYGNRLIHRVDYNISWYRDGTKDDGGWSLALIDYNHRCGSAGEWIASTNQVGGTPGQPNGINPAYLVEQVPRLYSWDVPDPEQIDLIFNQALTSPGSELSLGLIPNLSMESYEWDESQPNELHLHLLEDLQTQQLYQLQISGLNSCSGESLNDTSLVIGVPRDPHPGDLLWSEILFDPYPGGYDFVELFNTSSAVVSLDSVFIASSIGTIDEAIPLSPLGNVLPGQYLAWSPNRSSLQKQYRLLVPGNVYNLSLPSLPNSEGSILLFYHDDQGSPQLLDALHYFASWHHPLLTNPEGFSLERKDFTLSTGDPENWTSASASAGGATPGYLNSTQSSEVIMANHFLNVHPVFTPDDDGRDDQAELDYSLNEPGYVVNATIFDMLGKPVANPYNQYSLSREGVLYWDGRNENGHLLPMGRYVWFLEIFNLDGTVERFKKTVVLAR